MFRNFILVGLRALWKNKVFTFINIGGLSVAISFAIVTFAFVDFFYRADEFHEDSSKIYAVQQVTNLDNQRELWGYSPVPLGPALKEELHQVDDQLRINIGSAIVSHQGNVFEESITFVDNNFFEFFSFPVTGSTELSNPNSIVISERVALKYFGNENPLTKEVHIEFFVDGKKLFQSFNVIGVAKEFPKTASFRFGIAVPFDTQKAISNESMNNWKVNTAATFIKVKSGEDIEDIIELAQGFAETANRLNSDWPIEGYHLEPLATASLNSYKVNSDIFRGLPKNLFISLIVIVSFLMAMACFNYMNIVIATSALRFKEIGIRKVIGSTRAKLIMQFLIENIILCFISLVIGIILAESFLIPGFKTLLPIDFDIEYTNNYTTWVFFMGIVMATAIGGAGYPILHLSSFGPNAILKDNVRIAKKNVFRRTLLLFQFFLSFLTIASAITFIQNEQYRLDKNWGYNQNQKIVVAIEGQQEYEQFKNEIIEEHDVVNVVGSKHQMGRTNGTTVIEIDEQFHQVNDLKVGSGYLESMGISLQSGRLLTDQLQGDYNAVVINETFSDQYVMKDPVGEIIKIGGEKYEIIGKVHDFHYQAFGTLIKPVIIRLAKPDEYQYLTISLTADNSPTEKAEILKSSWSKIQPLNPFEYSLQESVFDRDFQFFGSITTMMISISFSTIFIAIIGLFGLTAIIASGKLKELSIRKVLGADHFRLGLVLNKEFIVIITLAILLAWPVSSAFLNFFIPWISKYSIAPQAPVFISTALILIFISFASIIGQLMKAINSNPSKILRTE